MANEVNNTVFQLWLNIEKAKSWFLPLTGIAAVALLLALLLYDICTARRSRTLWFPAKALLINALCLTLLGHVFRPFQDLLEVPDKEFWDKPQNNDFEKMVEYLTRKTFSYEVLGLSGQRAVLCVFIGYILPSMAKFRQVFSADFLALLISLIITFYYTCMELYVLYVVGFSKGIRIENLLISVCMLHLVWVLVCALQASISIQDIADLKLCKLLRNPEINSLTVKLRNPPQFKNLQKKQRDVMLGLCIVARAFEPSYLITRSVLASSLFFAVTISSSLYLSGIPEGISFVFAKPEFQNDPTLASTKCDLAKHINVDDKKSAENQLYQVKNLVIVWVSMQCLFIFCGWAIICYRWMQSIVFCSKLVCPPSCRHLSQLLPLFRIENFWIRASNEIQHNYQLPAAKDLKGFKSFGKVLKALKLHNLFFVLRAFQVIMVWSSKICSLVSEVLLHPKLVVRVSMGSHAFREFCRLQQQELPDQNEEFHKLKDYLLTIDGENSLAVWVANLSYIDIMRTKLDEANCEGVKMKEFLLQANDYGDSSCITDECYLESPSDEEAKISDGNVKNKFDLPCFSVKMIVVSLLVIMFEVLAVYETVVKKSSSGGEGGVEAEKDVQKQDESLQNCINVVEQAWKVMSLAENSSKGAIKLSNAAEFVFKEIKKGNGKGTFLNHELPMTKTESIQVAVQKLKIMAEEEVQKSCRDEFDCINWTHAVAGAHMQIVCNKILKDQATDLKEIEQIKGFLKNLERSLASELKHTVSKSIDSFDQFWKNCNSCSSLEGSDISEMCIAMAMIGRILE